MGNSLEQWRASIGLFNSKCVIKQRVMVKVSMAFIFYYMSCLLKWAACSCKLLSNVFNHIVCNLFFKIVLILLLLEAGDIEMNPGPDTINSSLSFLHSNIRSIRNKFDYITENFLDFDILCFTESHLDANITTKSLIMSSKYDIPYRKDRTNHGGGLLMYLSCGLAHTRMIDLETFWNESIWVEIKLNRESYLIGLFYSPQTADAVFFDALNKNIERALDITNNIIILGDMNEDLLNPNMHHLKDVLLLNSLHNIISEPTRQLALLDPIILHNDMSQLNQGIIKVPPDISDHCATYVHLPFEYPVHGTFTRNVWMFKNANFELFNKKLSEFDWSCLHQGSVNEAISLFTNIFIEFAKLCIPSKTIVVREDDKPWYDSEIRRNSRKRDRLKKKAIQSGNPNVWNKYKLFRNKVNNQKKHAKELFYNNLDIIVSDFQNNDKRKFWKVIRHFVKNNKSASCIPPICSKLSNGDNQWHFNDQDKANCLNDYFASISKVNDAETQLPPFTNLTDNSLSQIICTELEIENIIEVLNPNKASGDDGISHKMLKNVSKTVSKPLCILMNRSFHEGIFPDIWKLANVIPIFKKGDKSEPSNYRPVALLSCIGKLQERIIFKNMYNFLIDNNLLYKYQSGFLPHHSTVFQLIDIFHNICQAFDNSMFSCIVFCDVSKAFDRVWHKGLLFKLRQNGIDGKLLEWLNSYLSQRKQKVCFKSCYSGLKSIFAGVPQGSVLGPLLFLVYINDIAKQLLSLTRLFADDSSLFYAAANIADIAGIFNHDLQLLSNWAKQWLVTFNPLKQKLSYLLLKK